MKYLKYLDKFNKDLTGKVFIVTGANAGLGFETTKGLLYLNATVIMACRNINKAKDSEKKLREIISTGKIIIEQYDQSDSVSINNFANRINQLYKIDGIVFNAGIYYPKSNMTTKDGLELTLGTNYFGQFLLLEALKEQINNNRNIRLVIVTSLTAYLAKNIELSKFDSLSRNKLYAYSKLLLAKECFELQNKENLQAILVHPGVCSTNILFNKDTGLPNAFSRLGRRFLNIFTHSAKKAALTSILGAICDYQPVYIKPRGLFAISGYPKIYKLPKKYYSSNLCDETREYLSQKVGKNVSY